MQSINSTSPEFRQLLQSLGSDAWEYEVFLLSAAITIAYWQALTLLLSYSFDTGCIAADFTFPHPLSAVLPSIVLSMINLILERAVCVGAYGSRPCHKQSSNIFITARSTQPKSLTTDLAFCALGSMSFSVMLARISGDSIPSYTLDSNSCGLRFPSRPSA